jgi:hypothetical protein
MKFEQLESKKLNNYASIFGGRIASPICTLAEITVTPNGNSKDAEEQEDPDGKVTLHDGTVLQAHDSLIQLDKAEETYVDVWISSVDASVTSFKQV